MRFIENGPDIPNELLDALDKEEVMFFCGAGVSQQNALLPDFIGLAKDVLKQLRVLEDAPASQILQAAQKVEDDFDLPAIVPVDRIFSELDKNFPSQIIETAVAKALKPKRGVNLTAHNVLLDLATIDEGHPRLVTTNFDRLFERCKKDIKIWQPPHLPVSTEVEKFNGVVYLHGMANKQYNNSENPFIISSAGFGRAYLTEGWARRFFREVISQYTVVFIGYAADDPPVRYMLEATGKNNNKSKTMYAFQSGTPQEASEMWEYKGVTAIPCNNHQVLWDTLDAMAQRKKDIKAWQDKIITMARKGPRQLSKFQREQVVQLVSTKGGAKQFCAGNHLPPASWLCVFDSNIRFSSPSIITQKNGVKRNVDLFNYYGLASDPVPKPIDPINLYKERTVPSEAWNVFNINTHDINEVQENLTASINDRKTLLDKNLPDRLYHIGKWIAPINGRESLSDKDLPDRLYYLGKWIAKIADQNITLWWVAKQRGIHPWVQESIRDSLQNKSVYPLHIVRSWQYLFDSWGYKIDDNDEYDPDWHLFQSELDKFGWSTAILRQYEEITKPRIKVRARFWGRAILPADVKFDSKQLLELGVVYKDSIREIEIPPERLAEVITTLKRNLDIAIRLESERGYYPYIAIPPIIPSNDPDISDPQQTSRLEGAVLYYAFLFERLLKLNPQQAKAELETWEKQDDNVYARLRIWSARFATLVLDDELGKFLSVISNKAFWNPNHRHDFLRTLKARWVGMPDATRIAIENRILQGPQRWEDESQDEYIKFRAWYMLDYLVWLKDKGCVLSAAADKEIEQLQKIVPEYTQKHASDTDRSERSMATMVMQNSDPSDLIGLQPSEILPKVKEIMRNNDYIQGHNIPFDGLCEKHPRLAILALCYAEEHEDNFCFLVWRTFLNQQNRKDDSERIKKFTAQMLVRMPDKIVIKIRHAVASWLFHASEQLTPVCVPIFQQLTKRLIKIIQENHKTKKAKIYRNTSMQLIDTPAWYLTSALFNDLRIKKLKANQSPPPDWMSLAEDMLNLPDDLGRDALMLFIRRLDWFYYVNPQWTQDNLLQPIFEEDSGIADAWWVGYLAEVRRLPTPKLFQKIKPYLLARASNPDNQRRNESRKMMQLILLGWQYRGKVTQRISDEEFHKILLNGNDNFRSNVLRQIKTYCEEDSNPPYWKNKRLTLLKKVWPLEKQVKTPQTSERLIDLTFEDEQDFPRLARIIIPMLGEMKQWPVMSLERRIINNAIIDKHPEVVLEILHRVVPQTLDSWTQQSGKILDRLTAASPKLKDDPRLIELQRRWSAR